MSAMDELEISDIINGINNVTMRDYKTALIQCLINKVADNLETLTEINIRNVATISLTSLQVEKKSENIDLFLTLLSNLTISIQSCEVFMSLLESEAKLYANFRFIIDNFLSNNPQLEDNISDPSEWVNADPWQNTASILCNLCQCTAGRKVLLNKSYGYVNKLVIQIRSKNATRRRGAVSCIRR